MVTDEMVEKAARCIEPDAFAILDGGDQWRIINSHHKREATRTKARAALEAALSAAEPAAAMTTDYLGCEHCSTDIPLIEKIATAGSKGATKVVYLYAAPPAPSGAVKALELSGVPDALAYGKGIWRTCTGCHESNEGYPTGPFSDTLKCHLGGGCFECGGIGAVWDATDYEDMGNFIALSAQVQDVAGWQDISNLDPKDGMIVMGWGEYRERDGFSPAFMRWYDSVGGWSVSAMPFYPTHWMPLPAAPAKQEG